LSILLLLEVCLPVSSVFCLATFYLEFRVRPALRQKVYAWLDFLRIVSRFSMTAAELKAILDLQPLPKEGGFFKEIFRAPEVLPVSSLPDRYTGDRSTLTSIFYLLEPSTFSAFHRLKSDEIYHFYLGDPVSLYLIDDSGSLSQVTLGHDVLSGHHLQYLVPKGVWQASCLVPVRLDFGLGDAGQKSIATQVQKAFGRDTGATSFALLGCTVAPGFEFADYEHGERESLLQKYPGHHDLIVKMTRL
jgi:predicted cupin superfamily sugar epimerase